MRVRSPQPAPQSAGRFELYLSTFPYYLVLYFCKMKISILKSILSDFSPSTSVKCHCSHNEYVLNQRAVKHLAVLLI